MEAFPSFKSIILYESRGCWQQQTCGGKKEIHSKYKEQVSIKNCIQQQRHLSRRCTKGIVVSIVIVANKTICTRINQLIGRYWLRNKTHQDAEENTKLHNIYIERSDKSVFHITFFCLKVMFTEVYYFPLDKLTDKRLLPSAWLAIKPHQHSLMQIAAQHIMHASTVDALTTGAQSRVEEERAWRLERD